MRASCPVKAIEHYLGVAGDYLAVEATILHMSQQFLYDRTRQRCSVSCCVVTVLATAIEAQEQLIALKMTQ